MLQDTNRTCTGNQFIDGHIFEFIYATPIILVQGSFKSNLHALKMTRINNILLLKESQTPTETQQSKAKQTVSNNQKTKCSFSNSRSNQ